MLQTIPSWQAARLIEAGHVQLNQKPPKKAGVKLRDGDRIDLVVPVDPLDKPPVAEDIPLDILHVDSEIAVVNPTRRS